MIMEFQNKTLDSILDGWLSLLLKSQKRDARVACDAIFHTGSLSKKATRASRATRKGEKHEKRPDFTGSVRDLILYHLYNNPSAEESIRRELSRKLDAIICHERFTQYKTAATEAEREQARQRYLESIGMPADFRW